MSAAAPLLSRPCFDPDIVKDYLQSRMSFGGVYEVRALKAGVKGTVSGYFDDWKKAFPAVSDMEKLGASGTYMTLNPTRPDLLPRSCNRMQERAARTTSDQDISCR